MYLNTFNNQNAYIYCQKTPSHAKAQLHDPGMTSKIVLKFKFFTKFLD